MHKKRTARQSTLDIGLPDGTGDREYLAAVGGALPDVLAAFRPDLVLYDAGAPGGGAAWSWLASHALGDPLCRPQPPARAGLM